MNFKNPEFAKAVETLELHYGLIEIVRRTQVWPHTVSRWRNGHSIPRALTSRKVLNEMEREMTAPPVPAVAVSPGPAAPPGSPGAPGPPSSIDSLFLQAEIDVHRLREEEAKAARAEGREPKLTVEIERLELRLTKLCELQQMEAMDKEIADEAIEREAMEAREAMKAREASQENR